MTAKKMKIYAKPNSTEQLIDYTKNPKCPNGYIEMKNERPAGNYRATNDGAWEEVPPDLDAVLLAKSIEIEEAEKVAMAKIALLFMATDKIKYDESIAQCEAQKITFYRQLNEIRDNDDLTVFERCERIKNLPVHFEILTIDKGISTKK